jgi:hypothetical protein
VDPDPDWIRIQRLCGSGFRDSVDPDPDPYWESGSRGKKFKWEKCTFWLFFKKILPLKSTNYPVLFEKKFI